MNWNVELRFGPVKAALTSPPYNAKLHTPANVTFQAAAGYAVLI